MPGYWPMKSEPDEASIEQLARAPNQTLAGMQVLRRGNRLSITRVSPDEWRAVLVLLED